MSFPSCTLPNEFAPCQTSGRIIYQDWGYKSTFDGAYRKSIERGWDGFPSAGVGARSEVKLHFVRGIRGAMIQLLADQYEPLLGPASFNKRFVIIGGGFGWVAQELRVRGFTNIVVVDTSAYVQAEKANTDEQEIRDAILAVGLNPDTGRGAVLLERGSPAALRGPRGGTIPIVDANIAGVAGRNTVESTLGGQPEIVISEDVATGLEDSEMISLHNDMSARGGNPQIAHMVTALPVGTVGVPARYNAPFNWKTLADWKALLPSATWIDVQTGDVL